LRTVAWNPSGSRLAFGLDQVAVHTADGERLGVVDPPTTETTWCWLDDDRFIVGSADQDLHTGNCATFELSEPLCLFDGRVVTIAKADEQHVIAAAADGPIRLVSVEAKKTEPLQVQAHDEGARRVVWAPGGDRVATAGGSKATKVWDATTLQLLHELVDSRQQEAIDVAWHPQRELIATMHSQKRLNLWNPATYEHTSTLTAPESGLISFHPTEPTIAVSNAFVHLLSIPSGTPVWSDNSRNWGLMTAFSPDGRLLGAETTFGTVWIFDAKSGKRFFADAAARRAPGRGTGASWSPDGELFAVGSNTIRVYSVSTLKLVRELSGHRGEVKDVAFDPTGRRIASVGSDGNLILWDAATGALLLRLPVGSSQSPQSLSWDPGGGRIAVLSNTGQLQILGAANASRPSD
jgi:WD40 repeat protein